MTYSTHCQCGNRVRVGDTPDNSIVVCDVCGAEIIIPRDDVAAKPRNKKSKRVGRFNVLGCLLKVGCAMTIVAVILFISIPVWWNGSPKEVERELALVQAGEPLTPEELEQFYPTPPPESDPTHLWLSGSTPLESDRFTELAEDLPLVGGGDSSQIPLPGQEWADLEAAESLLAHYEKELKLLHRAAELGGAGRYPTRFQEGMMMELPHMSRLRTGAYLLALEAEVMAHREDGHAVAEAFHAIFQLSESLTYEPVMETQLSRWAITMLGWKRIARLLPVVDFSSDDLIRIQTGLRAIDFHDSCQRTLIGKRVYGLIAFDNPASIMTPESARDYLRSRYVDRAYYLRFMRRLISLSQQPWAAAVDGAWRLDKEFDEKLNQSMIFSLRHACARSLAQSLPTLVNVAARDDAFRRCADTGISVWRYHEAHSAWPESLDSLIPEFLPTAPIDPFNGKILGYRVDENELVVYSVGQDGVDDGGVEETVDRMPGYPDVVFRLELSASPSDTSQE